MNNGMAKSQGFGLNEQVKGKTAMYRKGNDVVIPWLMAFIFAAIVASCS